MQIEPLVRLWTAREGVTVRRVGDDAAGLLAVEGADGAGAPSSATKSGDEPWARLQRPWGTDAAALDVLVAEFRRLRADGVGVLVASLPAPLFDRFEAAAGVRTPRPAREEAASLDLAAWDERLRGGTYKTLRQAVRRAEKDGCRVVDYDPVAHRACADEAFRAWSAERDRGDLSWIPVLVDSPPPGTLAAVGLGPLGRVCEFAAYWRAGAYAYALAAFAHLDRARVTELLDTTLLRRLKAEGVVTLDWGVTNPATPGVDAYKEKFGPLRLETIVTAWYPL